MKKIAFAISLMVMAFTTNAQNFDSTFITDPSLVGKAPGLDGLWGTGDDVTLPGFNTIGAASAFGFNSPTDNTFGFWQGTSKSVVNFPNYELTEVNVSGEASCSLCGIFNFTNAPISASLAPGGPHTGTITSAGGATFNTFNALMTFVVSSGIDETIEGDTINFAGVDFGVILFAGQDPETQFAGNQAVINHFNFLLPLLPSGWESVHTDLQIITILDGIRAGLTGTQSLTSYSVASPIPLPASLPLLLGALGILYRKRLHRNS